MIDEEVQTSNPTAIIQKDAPGAHAPSPAKAGLDHLSDEIAINFLMTVEKQAPLPEAMNPSASQNTGIK